MGEMHPPHVEDRRIRSTAGFREGLRCLPVRVVEGGHTGSRAGSRRVDLATAAAMLGISSDAVRKRAKRGTLAHERGPDGKLYVWVDTGESNGYPSGESGPGRGRGTGGDTNRFPDELLGELRDRVGFLERQLDAERDAHAETRRIAAMLAARVGEIEAPSERREDHASGSEPVGEDRDWGTGSESQEGVQVGRRSWWRRWLFG